MERLQGVEGVRPTAYSTAYTYHKMKSIVLEFIGDSLCNGARILDVGCGRGHDLLRISEKYQERTLKLYGIEVVREDALVAARRAVEHPGNPSISVLMSEAEKLPFREEQFDAVICSEVIEHLPNPDMALREIARVTKPGGTLAITTPNMGNKLHKLRKFLPTSLRSKANEWREMQKVIDSERRSADGVNLPHVSELTAGQWCGKCRSAGFEVLETRRGSLLFGDPYLESRPVLWAASVMMDRVLDNITDDWSWQILIKAKRIVTSPRR